MNGGEQATRRVVQNNQPEEQPQWRQGYYRNLKRVCLVFFCSLIGLIGLIRVDCNRYNDPTFPVPCVEEPLVLGFIYLTHFIKLRSFCSSFSFPSYSF